MKLSTSLVSLQYRDSDSGADRTLQLRRIEFEKRRMRKELKRRKQKLRQTSSGGEDSLNAALEHNMLERSLPDDRWPFYAGRYDGDQRYADPDLDINPRFNDINWQSGPKHGQCNEPDRHSDYIREGIKKNCRQPLMGGGLPLYANKIFAFVTNQ